MKFSAKFFLLVSFGATLSAAAMSGGRMMNGMRSVGAGILYASPNHALFENPAVLVDSPRLSVEGLYKTEGKGIHASAVAGFGMVGVGGGWRKETSDAENTYEGGVGLAVGRLSLGGAVRKVGSGGLDGDAAAMFDFTSLRLGAVARGISGGTNRIDAGVGFMMNQITFEFDVKKPKPFSDGNWFFDAGLALAVGPLSAGVGYDFSKVEGTSGMHGDVHAGLGFSIGNRLVLEGYYRPMAQEWNDGKWAVGAKAMF